MKRLPFRISLKKLGTGDCTEKRLELESVRPYVNASLASSSSSSGRHKTQYCPKGRNLARNARVTLSRLGVCRRSPKRCLQNNHKRFLAKCQVQSPAWIFLKLIQSAAGSSIRSPLMGALRLTRSYRSFTDQAYLTIPLRDNLKNSVQREPLDGIGRHGDTVRRRS